MLAESLICSVRSFVVSPWQPRVRCLGRSRGFSQHVNLRGSAAPAIGNEVSVARTCHSASGPPVYKSSKADGRVVPPAGLSAGSLVSSAVLHPSFKARGFGIVPPPAMARSRRPASEAGAVPWGVRDSEAQAYVTCRLTTRCSGRGPGICSRRGHGTSQLRSATCTAWGRAAELIIR
jgi:hypothetical protein